MEITHNVYHTAGDILKKRGKFFGVADEGGYWPEFKTNEEALQLMVEAIQQAGYLPSRDAAISLDIAASDLFDEKTRTYRFALENEVFSNSEFAGLLSDWCKRYPYHLHRGPNGRHRLGRLANDLQRTRPSLANHRRRSSSRQTFSASNPAFAKALPMPCSSS